MKKNTIFMFMICFLGNLTFAQTPKQKFYSKFQHLVESNIKSARISNSIFLLEKIDIYEGKENIIEPKEFPTVTKKFNYYSDNRLKSESENNEFGLFVKDYTYLNSKDNLYSTIKKTQTGSFGSSLIDSFFYDDKKREIRRLSRSLTGDKKVIGLDSTFYESDNKNFSIKKNFLTLDFGGPVATILRGLTQNTLQNDNILKTETSYLGLDGKKTFEVKTEFVLDPINNVLITTEYSKDTATSSPWIPLYKNNKKVNNDGLIIYESNYEYEPNISTFLIIDSLHNYYSNDKILQYVDFFILNSSIGQLIQLDKAELVYDKNQNLDSLKFLAFVKEEEFKLYSFERYFWKEIKNVSSRDIIQPKLDFDIIENNNASLVINIHNMNPNSYYVQINSLDGKLLFQTKTNYDNQVRLNTTQSGAFLVSIFDEKGNVKTKKVWIR